VALIHTGRFIELAHGRSWKPAQGLLLHQLCEQALQQRQGQSGRFTQAQHSPTLD
jgi:hypothetical protein